MRFYAEKTPVVISGVAIEIATPQLYLPYGVIFCLTQSDIFPVGKVKANI